jgi:hypothetical protein
MCHLQRVADPRKGLIQIVNPPASFVLDHNLRVVSAAAAEEAAAVAAAGLLVAASALSPHHAGLRVLLAVVGAGLDVDQGLLAHWQLLCTKGGWLSAI